MSLTTERFLLQGREIDFDLHRKKTVRRNIHIRFEDNGRMQVSAPLRSSKKSIQRVLSGMHDEIAELRRQSRELIRDIPSLRYRQGAQHPFRGRYYPLDIWRGPDVQPHVRLRSDRIEVLLRGRGEQPVSEAMLRWYRERAETYFTQRLEKFSAELRWVRQSAFELKLRRMKRSWGTCSASGLITLNPMLMKASPRQIDYVIAHELCHLREMNHSADFYRLLTRIEPDWKNLQSALNDRARHYLRW